MTVTPLAFAAYYPLSSILIKYYNSYILPDEMVSLELWSGPVSMVLFTLDSPLCGNLLLFSYPYYVLTEL